MTSLHIITSFAVFLKYQKLSPQTIKFYSQDVTEFITFWESQLLEGEELKLKEIEIEALKFLDYIKYTKYLSDKTISRKINSLKKFGFFLWKKELLSFNFGKIITIPKIEKQKISFLNRSEILAIQNHLTEFMMEYFLFEFLLQTGLQVSKIIELKWENINIDKQQIVVHVDKIPFNKRLKLLILEYKQEINPKQSHLIFKSKTGRKFSTRMIRKIFDKIYMQNKIRGKTVNDIRNTFIIEQLQCGVSTIQIARWILMKTPTSINRYISLVNIDTINLDTNKIFKYPIEI